MLILGYDGVELNVLDDILGEQANDEFAAELDTPAVKTSGKLRLLLRFTSLLYNWSNRIYQSFHFS